MWSRLENRFSFDEIHVEDTPAPIDWKRVEKRLGVGLPPSYKELLSRTGPLLIAGGRIQLLAPESSEPGVLSMLDAQELLEEDGELYPDGLRPLVWPAPGGLLPVAIDTSASVYLCWRVGESAQEWPLTLLDLDEGEQVEIAHGALEFLEGYLNDELDASRIWDGSHYRSAIAGSEHEWAAARSSTALSS